MTERIVEKELVFPALLVLAQAKIHLQNPKVSTSDLKKAIFSTIEDDLSDEDNAPLKNRNDSKVHQVIRNLISNKPLEKEGLAVYDPEEKTLEITQKGLSFIGLRLAAMIDPYEEILKMKQREVIKAEEAKQLEESQSQETVSATRRRMR